MMLEDKTIVNENVSRQIRIVKGPKMPEGKEKLLDLLIEKYEINEEQVPQSKFWIKG